MSSNITINIVEPGTNVVPVPNTGLFTNGIGGPEATIIGLSSLVVLALAITTFFIIKHRKVKATNNLSSKSNKDHKKNTLSSKLSQSLSSTKKSKKAMISLSILALLSSTFSLATLSNLNHKDNVNAEESEETSGLTVNAENTELTIEVGDEPVYAVLPVTITVAEETAAGYTLSAYTENNALVSTTDSSKVIPMITEEGTTPLALSDNTYGLALTEPTSQTDELFYSLSTDQTNPTFITDKNYEATNPEDETTIYYGFYITPDIPYGTYTNSEINYTAEENGTPATITFDGNGLYFNDDGSQTTNTMKFLPGSIGDKTYVSHTPNVNDEGIQTEGEMYPLDSNETFVYTFDDYTNTYLEIVKTDGDNSCGPDSSDYFSFWPGNHPDYTAKDNWESGIKISNGNGKYMFYKNSSFNGTGANISSNAVTVAYTTSNTRDSWCVEPGYGYYAKITGYNENKAVSGTYELPATTKEDYEFLGWSTDPYAGTPMYTTEQLLSPIDNEIILGSNTTLYAVWKGTTPFDINYDGNNASAGSMDSTKDDVTTTLKHENVLLGDTIELYAPNYKKEGYGFIGWSADKDAWTHLNDNDNTNDPKIYGPNESITVDRTIVNGIDSTTNSSNLYATWADTAKDSNNQELTFQTTNLENITLSDGTTLSSKPIGYVTALKDTRDDQVYAVAKLKDGNYWMIENLRLDDTATLDSTNTNNPLITKLSATSNSWSQSINHSYLNTNNTRLGDTSLIPSYNASTSSSQWYSYGNYYNWYSATAGNGTKETGTNITVSGDICPTGWHLPYGGDGDGSEGSNKGNTSGGFSFLDRKLGGTGYSQMTFIASNRWRSFPNNFIRFGGLWFVTSFYNVRNFVYDAYYWSSTANDMNSAYNLFFNLGANMSPGNSSAYKYNGFSVRCVLSE